MFEIDSFFRHRDQFQDYVQNLWFRSQHNDPSAHFDTALRVIYIKNDFLSNLLSLT